jgi:hypothetical protein
MEKSGKKWKKREKNGNRKSPKMNFQNHLYNSSCETQSKQRKQTNIAMIDIATEKLVTFSQALTYLPRRKNGNGASVETIRVWAVEGIEGVKLEIIRAGNKRCTSVEALQRFFDTLTQIELTGQAPVVPRKTTAARQKQIDAAIKKLKAAGAY